MDTQIWNSEVFIFSLCLVYLFIFYLFIYTYIDMYTWVSISSQLRDSVTPALERVAKSKQMAQAEINSTWGEARLSHQVMHSLGRWSTTASSHCGGGRTPPCADTWKKVRVLYQWNYQVTTALLWVLLLLVIDGLKAHHYCTLVNHVHFMLVRHWGLCGCHIITRRKKSTAL